MRTMATGFGAVGVLLMAAAVFVASWGGMPGGVGVLGILFMDAAPMAKLVMMLLAPVLVALLVMGALALTRNPPRGQSDGLSVLGFTAAGAGLLAGLYESINIHLAMQAVGVSDLRVIAPGVAEVLLVAGLGLVVGAVGLGLNAAAGARAHS